MIELAGMNSYEVEGREKSCSEVVCGCCNRGGCCRNLPSKIICNGDRQPIRINLCYSPQKCFTQSNGIDDKIPIELLNAGLTVEEADEWLVKRLTAVNKYRSSACRDCLLIAFCCVPFFCFAPYFCRRGSEEIYQWNEELQKWQDDFNKTVLADKGLFVKTQSHCTNIYSGTTNRDIERWIAIALTREESDKLRGEPHLSGNIDNDQSCGGVDENRLCIHP